jgi:signal transduction histidine kinase
VRRLYVRIYVAMLASLVLFALLAGAAWKLSFDRERAWRDERALVAEAVGAILPPADAPVEALRAALERWHARTGADLTIFDAERRPIASAGRPLPPPSTADGGRDDHGRGPPVWSVRLPDGRWAIARLHRFRGPPSPIGWLLPILGLTVAVAIGAYPVVRRLTRRLERLQAGVEALGAGDLSARVPVQGRDEVAALAASFNRSAERIEALVRAQRSLLANASHELRSPLARLKMASALLADPQAAAGQTEAERAALREELERNVGELDALIEEILLASRLDADAGVAREPVDLLALLAEEAARVQATLSVDRPAGETAGAPRAGTPQVGGLPAGVTDDTLLAGAATVDGDARLLRRLVRNLLENARRYGAGSPVEVRLHPVGPASSFEVLDRGPGVPEAERERIFEPFHRLAGHGEAAGGVGLGLSLVRQIAARHGATVRCLPRDGGGSRFVVAFGAAPVPR